MIDKPSKTVASDLSYPAMFGLSFDDFTNPIDLTNQSYTPIGGSDTAWCPQKPAGLIILQNLTVPTDPTDLAIFALGIGADVPMTITLAPGQTLVLRGAWTSIQGVSGDGSAGAEVQAFWTSQE